MAIHLGNESRFAILNEAIKNSTHDFTPTELLAGARLAVFTAAMGTALSDVCSDEDRKETIEEMFDNFFELLMQYYSAQGVTPDRIADASILMFDAGVATVSAGAGSEEGAIMNWEEYLSAYVAQVARRHWRGIRERQFYPVVDFML